MILTPQQTAALTNLLEGDLQKDSGKMWNAYGRPPLTDLMARSLARRGLAEIKVLNDDDDTRLLTITALGRASLKSVTPEVPREPGRRGRNRHPKKEKESTDREPGHLMHLYYVPMSSLRQWFRLKPNAVNFARKTRLHTLREEPGKKLKPTPIYRASLRVSRAFLEQALNGELFDENLPEGEIVDWVRHP